MGNALDDSGDRAGAIHEYETAIRIEPQYALAHFNLGLTLERLGRHQEALVHYQTACYQEPGTALFCNTLRRLQTVR